jgi:anti-sigma factor (TIGR02949 family)
LLTCKEFLQELDQYLEKSLDPAEYAELQKHVNECPNCFVVCDTTEKTLRVFKGMDCKPVPADIKARLMSAIEAKMKAKCEGAAATAGDSSESRSHILKP